MSVKSKSTSKKSKPGSKTGGTKKKSGKSSGKSSTSTVPAVALSDPTETSDSDSTPAPPGNGKSKKLKKLKTSPVSTAKSTDTDADAATETDTTIDVAAAVPASHRRTGVIASLLSQPGYRRPTRDGEKVTSSWMSRVHARLKQDVESPILCQRRSVSAIWKRDLISVPPGKGQRDKTTCRRCLLVLRKGTVNMLVNMPVNEVASGKKANTETETGS